MDFTSLTRLIEGPWLLPALAGVAGMALGALIVRLGQRARLVAAHEAGALAADDEARAHIEELAATLDARSHELARSEVRVETLLERVATLQDELAARDALLVTLRAAEATLSTRLEEGQRSFAEKEALLQGQMENLRLEFERLARRVFEHESAQQQHRLSAVLEPLRAQLADFRQRVDTVYDTDSRDRASLLTEVRNLQQASERINREAESLTRALKGDVKAQGNWGELVLERVLESSGLRLDEEYLLQPTLRDAAGGMKRPDVIVRLPDGKDIIVDAKLSLLAYERHVAAESEEARQGALREHVASLRGHVRRLAEQDYDRLGGVRSLDFVLLFVPIESAFSAAMAHDSALFTDAFQRRIVIVSPTTLMMTLRIIHNVWRYEKQHRNAEEIARRAGALYDKVRGLVDDMDTLGRQLQTAHNTWNGAMGKLVTGRGNLIRQVDHFRELGAPVRVPMPEALLRDARDYPLDDPESTSAAPGLSAIPPADTKLS